MREGTLKDIADEEELFDDEEEEDNASMYEDDIQKEAAELMKLDVDEWVAVYYEGKWFLRVVQEVITDSYYVSIISIWGNKQGNIILNRSTSQILYLPGQ